MNLSITEQNGVMVVRVEGSLDTSTAPEAQEILLRLTDTGVQKILVDFENLDYISSAGLHTLLITAKNLRGVKGSLRICCLNDMATEVFQISGFDTILSIFPSQAEALEGF